MFEFDTLVIGGNLNAVIYAFANDLPIIVNQHDPPKKWENFSFNYDLSNLYINPWRTPLKLFSGKAITQGNEKLDIYGRLLFSMSLAGLVPFHNKNTKIMIEKNTIDVVMGEKSSFTCAYKKLILFDDRNVLGLPECIEEDKSKRKVLDWFEVPRNVARAIKNYDIITFENSFIDEVYLYYSARASASKKKLKARDLVCCSYLTPEEIENDDYNEIVVRYKIEEELKKYDEKIILKHTGRDVKYKMNKYKNTRKLIFNYDPVEKIISSVKDTGSYNHVLVKHFRKFDTSVPLDTTF